MTRADDDRLRWFGYAPAAALTANQAAVLAAVLNLHAHHASIVYGDLVAATGLSRAIVNKHLRALRGLGLVAWEDGRTGTLRPLVVPVAVA